jgi:hypothetical protein
MDTKRKGRKCGLQLSRYVIGCETAACEACLSRSTPAFKVPTRIYLRVCSTSQLDTPPLLRTSNVQQSLDGALRFGWTPPLSLLISLLPRWIKDKNIVLV